MVARILLVLLFGAATAGLQAQTVAEDVVKGQEIQGIEFRNYVGPHRVIESRAAIQGIGTDLGRQIREAGASEADYGRKYHILRIHDPSASLLSADLLILEAGAGVDHIRNLNWIVSAYLQAAFSYSLTDADLLAGFVTRYNAFYRGKMDYFRAQYIPAVGANLTAENAGLALSYADWPGKTRIVIPLRDSLSKGLGGSLNTEEISNRDVVTELTKQPDGLDQRKKLADLKEAEIVQEQKAVAQAEGQKALTVPSGLGTTAASPSSTPSAESPAPSSTPTAKPSALPLEQAKEDLAKRDQALQAERQDIVKQDPKPSPTPSPSPVAKPAATVAFVRMNESTNAGQVWLIDPTRNAVWKKSELNSVRQPMAPAFGAGYLVVAGDGKSANGAVRLVLLSKDDASISLTGNDDVLPETPLVITGNLVLVVVRGPSGWVLGLYDSNLNVVAKGTEVLSAATSIVPTANGILVQLASGAPVLLDTTTLKKKSNTEG